MAAISEVLKRGLVGRPLRSDRLGEQLLPRTLALPVFCSDPLSSVAYATEAILAILAYGGLSFYGAAPWLAAAVTFLLVIVTASYRQTIFAYPNGGGAYTVSQDNLGLTASLVAASALMVDYVLTVAVSVAAGVAAITSAVPSLYGQRVNLSVGFTVLIMALNLRGVKESGKAFAVPTYGFVVGVYLMFAVGAYKIYVAHASFVAPSAAYHVLHPERTGGLLTLFLFLRAFANGCTALTGVEAISNGVPAFRKPKSKNAAGTLTMMAVFAVTMFVGITLLALRAHVHSAEDLSVFGLHGAPQSALSQISAVTFGRHSFMFGYLTAFTTGILVLAANTAFNGFPVLASILARDRFLPRQLHNRGDRLVYSNGILLLAAFAVALLVGLQASVDKLLQLYIIGVFVSFTLSQSGMVRHWSRALRDPALGSAQRRGIRRSQSINFGGACATAVVLLVVLATKFTHGAWIAIVAMVVLYAVMRSIRRHYDAVARELAVPAGRPPLPSRVHAVVLVSRLHSPTLRALAYAKATRPSTLEAITVSVEADDTAALQREWERFGLTVPLTVVSSPYRDITKPVLDYVAGIRRESPRDVVAVFVPEYVVGRWWEQVLHNQTPLRIKARLLFQPGVMVTSVPFQLDSSKGSADYAAALPLDPDEVDDLTATVAPTAPATPTAPASRTASASPTAPASPTAAAGPAPTSTTGPA